jgi:hypothetical protein
MTTAVNKNGYMLMYRIVEQGDRELLNIPEDEISEEIRQDVIDSEKTRKNVIEI